MPADLIVSELNLVDEYFTIANIGDTAVAMDEYHAVDAEYFNHELKTDRNKFIFADRCPGLSLAPGASVTVYGGPGSRDARTYDGKTSVHWHQYRVWTNTGDTCHLLTRDDTEVDKASTTAEALHITALDLVGESFTLRNDSKSSINLDEYSVTDHEYHRGELKTTRNKCDFKSVAPGHTLSPGDTVTIYCGHGSGTARTYDDANVHWHNYKVWNDTGDCVHLLRNGEEVHKFYQPAN